MRVVVAPVPGEIGQVHVEPGAPVAAGQLLFSMEVMEMRQQVVAPVEGRIRLLLVKKGDKVTQGALLAEITQR
jgi:biotin carboxyl carrier protein